MTCSCREPASGAYCNIPPSTVTGELGKTAVTKENPQMTDFDDLMSENATPYYRQEKCAALLRPDHNDATRRVGPIELRKHSADSVVDLNSRQVLRAKRVQEVGVAQKPSTKIAGCWRAMRHWPAARVHLIHGVVPAVFAPPPFDPWRGNSKRANLIG